MSHAQTSASAHSVKTRPYPSAGGSAAAPRTGSADIDRCPAPASPARVAIDDEERRADQQPERKEPRPRTDQRRHDRQRHRQRDTAPAACACAARRCRSAHSAIINMPRTTHEQPERQSRRARSPRSATAISADAGDDADRQLGQAARAREGSLTGRRTGAGAARTRATASASVVGVEIGPQRVDEQQFGIGRLPQQEIGQPLLARRADQQVERRQVARVELGRRSRRRRSLRRSISPSRTRSRQLAAPRAASSACDAVIERDHQQRPGIARGPRHRIVDHARPDRARSGDNRR